ncbi:unnamed protein product, partial [marine sediment metagenome]
VFADILRVGEAADSTADAEALLERLRQRVARIAATTGALEADARRRTCIIEWIDPPMLAANWVPELLELAGGVCPLVTGGSHSSYAAWERVVEFDPEVIVVTPCGFDIERTMRESAGLASLAGFSDLSAVRAGTVFAIDGSAYFNRSGPRLVESLEILAHLLHPRLCGPPLAESARGNAWRRIDCA